MNRGTRPALGAAVLMLLLCSCGGQGTAEPSADASSAGATPTSSAASSSAAAPSSSASGDLGSASSGPGAPSPLPTDDLPAGTDISVFAAQITEASWGQVRHPVGHDRPGTPAVLVRLRLENRSDRSVDAAYLSAPSATLDGRLVAGTPEAEDPAQAAFGVIPAGGSASLLIAYPADSAPQRITVHLQDPADPGTAADLTAPVTGGR